MPTYEHFQDLKKATTLPRHDKVGACLTCRYWDVGERRGESIAPRLARCIQPQLEPYALLVSGSSACNKWAEVPGKGPAAAAYAERGEENKDEQKAKAKHAAAAKRATAKRTAVRRARSR